jgi:acyl-CoA reductase-like NAD-dependent aldehyde dehydrogenase
LWSGDKTIRASSVDAELDRAAIQGLLVGAFLTAGQACVAITCADVCALGFRPNVVNGHNGPSFDDIKPFGAFNQSGVEREMRVEEH